MAKSKRVKSAERINEHLSLFICPLCEKTLTVNRGSLRCPKNHTFDIARQGYVNMLTQQASTQYDKQLFDSRFEVIDTYQFYKSMHETIIEVIRDNVPTDHALTVADIGCGEGSHLHQIAKNSGIHTFTGIGLDISKEGILAAAKRYEDFIWLVGDLAQSPFSNQSFQVILNILSPSNYNEFNRILTDDGIVIKVIPGSSYLKELRNMLFSERDHTMYSNTKTKTLFKEQFHLIDHVKLNDVKPLEQAGLTELVQMTPLTWSAEKSQVNAFLKKEHADITIDLELLIGKKK